MDAGESPWVQSQFRLQSESWFQKQTNKQNIVSDTFLIVMAKYPAETSSVRKDFLLSLVQRTQSTMAWKAWSLGRGVLTIVERTWVHLPHILVDQEAKSRLELDWAMKFQDPPTLSDPLPLWKLQLLKATHLPNSLISWGPSVQTNEPIGGTFYIQALRGSGNDLLAKIVQCSIFFFYHFHSPSSFR